MTGAYPASLAVNTALGYGLTASGWCCRVSKGRPRGLQKPAAPSLWTELSFILRVLENMKRRQPLLFPTCCIFRMPPFLCMRCQAALCLFDRDTWAFGTHPNNLVISYLKVLGRVSRLFSDKVPLPEIRISHPWEHATGWGTGEIQLI